MSACARLRATARGLGERSARNLPAARRLRFLLAIDALERYADHRPLRVLDAGCGEGLLAEALARRHPDWQIVAADLDDVQLNQGRERVAETGVHNVRFDRVDVTEDLGDRAYDAVLAIECLEEIPDDEAALACMARALRPDGLFLAHVPERDWTPVLPGSERTWRHEVRHGYGADDLASKLSRAGLSPTVVRPSTRAVVRLAQEIRDRIKDRGRTLQLVAYPLSLAAVRLERWGLVWGRARALFVEARPR